MLLVVVAAVCGTNVRVLLLLSFSSLLLVLLEH
jgi:hypothetical protein